MGNGATFYTASASNSPNNTTHLYILDQIGLIIGLDLNSGVQSVLLDASNFLVPLGAFGPDSFDERGLLGFVFHPDYANNGLIYTYSSEPLRGRRTFRPCRPVWTRTISR